METNKEKIICQGQIYMVDGKEWIVGEQKISMFDKAKCNKIKEQKEEDKDKDKDKKDL